MPAQIPPWLQPATPADYWTKGLSLGLQVASQRQQAAQAAANQARMQQAQEAANARSEAEMQLQQARATAQTQLAQAAQQEKAQAAAQRFAAQQQYQASVQGGADPVKAMLQFGPAMGGSGANAALQAQQQQAAAAQRSMPPTVQKLPNGTQYLVDSSGKPHFTPASSANSKYVHVGNKLIDPETLETKFDGDSGKWSADDRMKWQAAARSELSAQQALSHPYISGDPDAVKEWQGRAQDAKKTQQEIEATYAGKKAEPPKKRFRWDPSSKTLIPIESATKADTGGSPATSPAEPPSQDEEEEDDANN